MKSEELKKALEARLVEIQDEVTRLHAEHAVVTRQLRETIDTMFTAKASVAKSVRLVVLLQAQNDGLLKDKTCQQIADAFGLEHRSTASRDLRDLDTVRDLLDEVTVTFLKRIPKT